MKYPIVVGTNFSRASNEALIRAEARASRDGVPLTVVHALSPRLWGSDDDAAQLDRLRHLVAEQVTALTGRQRNEYNVVVERGAAHVVLTRWAAMQRALLVVGSPVHHGVGHALLRDLGERVLERAWGPVLVARGRTESRRILVAVDRPFRTSPALDMAIAEARRSRAELSVLHCVNTSFLGTLAADIVNGDAYAQHPLGLHSPRNEARRALGSELLCRHMDPPLYIVEGEPAPLISQFASRTDADLLIIGTAHHPARTPSVTTAVLRHAPCSVLIVDDTSMASVADSAAQTRADRSPHAG